MKKLLLTLIALASIIGCSGEIRIEGGAAKPNPQPRLVATEHDSPMGCPYIYIIKDTENDVEYLCVRTGNGLSITPMIKKEVTAEKKE